MLELGTQPIADLFLGPQICFLALLWIALQSADFQHESGINLQRSFQKYGLTKEFSRGKPLVSTNSSPNPHRKNRSRGCPHSLSNVDRHYTCSTDRELTWLCAQCRQRWRSFVMSNFSHLELRSSTGSSYGCTPKSHFILPTIIVIR